MTESILKEYIVLLLKEEDEQQFADRTMPRTIMARHKLIQNTNFSFDELNKIQNLNQKNAYLDKSLKQIGVGSGRIVYDLNDVSVLKLARNEQGIEQNKQETLICKLDPQRYFFTKVSKADENYQWIVAEKVYPINPSIFKEHTGINWNDFVNALFVAFKDKVATADKPALINKEDDPDLKNIEQHSQQQKIKIYSSLMKTNPFFNKLIKITRGCNIEPGDISVLANWGITKNGRIVMLDYGLTDVVVKQFRNQLVVA